MEEATAEMAEETEMIGVVIKKTMKFHCTLVRHLEVEQKKEMAGAVGTPHQLVQEHPEFRLRQTVYEYLIPGQIWERFCCSQLSRAMETTHQV